MAYVANNSSLPRTLDVTVSLSRAQSETRTQLNVLCVAMESLGFLHDTNRIRLYSSIAAVETDFASGSEPWNAASAFFSQTPRATTMALGEVFLSAQPAMLVADEFTTAQLTAIKLISDGNMTFAFDDGVSPSSVALNGLDFTSIVDTEDIADVINDALGSSPDIEAVARTMPGGDIVLVIQTVATGDDVTLDEPTDNLTGTFVGTLLGLTTAGSVNSLDGYTPTTVADELASINNAAQNIDQNIYGWCLGSTLRTVAHQTSAATWAQARVAFMSLVTNSSAALDANDDTDIGSVVSDAGDYRVMVSYHSNATRYPDVSILAYLLHVNYQLKDSAVTAKFKVLPGIETVQLTETQWATLQSKGYNTYTAIGNSSRTWRDGNTNTSWYADSVINLDNLAEDISVAVFNVFLRNKKVPYTRAGQALILEAISGVGEQYTYNGVLAAREVADTTIKRGYRLMPPYILEPTPIYQMSVADRADRIGPPVGMTVYEAGAIHSTAIAVEVIS